MTLWTRSRPNPNPNPNSNPNSLTDDFVDQVKARGVFIKLIREEVVLQDGALIAACVPKRKDRQGWDHDTAHDTERVEWRVHRLR